MGRAQTEEHAGGRLKNVRRDEQSLDRLGEAGAIVVGIENQAASLLDERAGERIAEIALRQRERDRRARAGLAGKAGRFQRHDDFRARPGMFREIAGRARLADAARRARQLQRQLRRLDQRARRRRRAGAARRRELSLGARHAIAIGERVMERQRAAQIRAGRIDQRDRRRAGGDRGDVERREGRARAQQRERAVAANGPAAFDRRARRAAAALSPASGVNAPSTRASTALASARTTRIEPSGATIFSGAPA